MSYFDAVVVGAGPAGSTAALQMARNGLRVALFERGSYPGSKNMFGGVLYTESTAQIVPEFWNEAPLERIVTRDTLFFLDYGSAVELGFTGLRFGKAPIMDCLTLKSMIISKCTKTKFLSLVTHPTSLQ